MRQRQVMAAVLVVAGAGMLLAQSSLAGSPRVPRDAADWARFTPAERQAALDFQWREHLRLEAAGQLSRTVVKATVDLQTNQIASIAGPQVASITATATGTCQLTFDNQTSGTWTRAGGWADASAVVYYIYASRAGLQGKLIRDGTTIKNWYAEVYNNDWAENWTGWDFKWWYEHPMYTSKGYFGARVTNGGTWILGPDHACSVSGSP